MEHPSRPLENSRRKAVDRTCIDMLLKMRGCPSSILRKTVVRAGVMSPDLQQQLRRNLRKIKLRGSLLQTKGAVNLLVFFLLFLESQTILSRKRG
ncbi:hypothetical protein VTN96DRAFT_4697 [Rasamsonia emersonii]